MDWLAGLGQGFSNIGPAIQMLMMLQEAKAERDRRTTERREDITFRTQEGEKNRAQTQQLADTEARLQRERMYTEPLTRQGMFIDPSAYAGASKIDIPAPTMNVDPAAGAMQTGAALAQNAGGAEQRLQALRQKAATALQTANRGGPGAVQSFEGGMAIGQAPFPTQSVSSSTSLTGVVPDQLRLQELRIKSDALNDWISKAIQSFRAVNPYGANPAEEQRVIQDAYQQFQTLWPLMREEVMGTNQPLTGAGGGTVRQGTTVSGGATGPVIPPVTPPIPQNNNDPRMRYRSHLRRGY